LTKPAPGSEAAEEAVFLRQRIDNVDYLAQGVAAQACRVQSLLSSLSIAGEYRCPG
jgi:hypothetical protein